MSKKPIKYLISLLTFGILIASCGAPASNNVISNPYPVSPTPFPSASSFSIPSVPTGLVKGKVIDRATKAGVAGVRVEVKGVKPVVFAVSTASGEFTLNKVPQGRQIVVVASKEYAAALSNNIVAEVTAGNTASLPDIEINAVDNQKSGNAFIKAFDGLKYPTGVAVDKSSGNIYIADIVGINSILPIEKNRTEIKKVNADGGIVDSFGSKIFSSDTTDLFRLLKSAQGVGVDGGGNIFVADTGNNLVKKYGVSGKYISKIDKSFNGVFDVAVLTNGDIVISDPGNSRVLLMDASLNVRVDNLLSKNPSDGVRGIATDNADNIYVVDASGQKGQVIKKFDKFGVRLPFQFGSIGSIDPGSFSQPSDIAIDNRNGDIYVVDSGNNRIQRFNSDGNFLGDFGQFGSEAGSFNNPWGVAVDKEGYVYISDPHNSRVQKFSPGRAF